MSLNNDLQTVFKNRFDTAVALAGKIVGNSGKIVNEVQDISLSAIQAQVALLGKLAGAKNVDDVIDIQSEHAKAAYEAGLARSRKISELFADFSADAVKSIAAEAEQTKVPEKLASLSKNLQAAE